GAVGAQLQAIPGGPADPRVIANSQAAPPSATPPSDAGKAEALNLLLEKLNSRTLSPAERLQLMVATGVKPEDLMVLEHGIPDQKPVVDEKKSFWDSLWQ
ncbi:MAG: hypothetical protein HQL56_18420, partial [Magnetococcales bacterium]|nr:hypothetical protein [Magnetococcales bacterium]